MHALRNAFALCIFCTLCSPWPALHAEDTWQPQQHPASISRELHGFTEAIHHLYISSEVSARVQTIPVDIGETIVAGQQIQLDDELAQIQLRLAKAQAQQAHSNLSAAQTALEAAKALLAYRTHEEKRSTTLMQQHATSDAKHDAVVFQRQQASFNIDGQTSQTQAAQEGLAIAEVQSQQAAYWLARHQINLPVGWTVTQRLVEAQSLVQPGSRILALADTRQLRIRFAMSEDEIASLRHQLAKPISPQDTDSPTTPLSVTLLQNSARIPVSLKSINPDFDPISRKRNVELEASSSLFPEASGGQHCMLTLILPDPNDAVLIPRRFVNERFEQMRVQEENGTWHPILVMRRSADMLVVQKSQLPPHIVLRIPAADEHN